MPRGRKRREDITEEQRAQLRNASLLVYGKSTGIYVDDELHPLDWAKCGTEGNYHAHRRRGQNPCGPCRKASILARKIRQEQQKHSE